MLINYAYVTNSLGQRQTRTESGQAFTDYGNSLTRSYTYDGRGELVGAPEFLGTNAGTNPMPGRQDSYNYDNFGNRTSVSRLTGGAVPESYTPNSLNQYVSKENNDVSVAGTASTAANVVVQGTTAVSASRQGRFWEAEVGVSNSTSPWAGYLPVYAGDPGAGPSGTDLAQINSRWAQLGEVTQNFTYDNDGNLTNDGVWTYTWDGENRLTQMQPTSLAVSSGVPDYLIVFTYDYLGRRVQKRVTNLANGGAEVSSRRFGYDGWNLVAECTAPGGTTLGTLLRTYTWGLDIARSLSDAGGVGALVQIADQASVKTYLPGYDGNGNVAVLINGDTGALAADYQYDPFGQLLRSDEIDQTIYSQPFRFSTKFEDTETSLVYYGHRYYSASLGRFINRDPTEEAGGLNLYAFCANDGVNHWDVLGNNIGGSDIASVSAGPSSDTETVNWADGSSSVESTSAVNQLIQTAYTYAGRGDGGGNGNAAGGGGLSSVAGLNDPGETQWVSAYDAQWSADEVNGAMADLQSSLQDLQSIVGASGLQSLLAAAGTTSGGGGSGANSSPQANPATNGSSGSAAANAQTNSLPASSGGNVSDPVIGHYSDGTPITQSQGNAYEAQQQAEYAAAGMQTSYGSFGTMTMLAYQLDNGQWQPVYTITNPNSTTAPTTPNVGNDMPTWAGGLKNGQVLNQNAYFQTRYPGWVDNMTGATESAIQSMASNGTTGNAPLMYFVTQGLSNAYGDDKMSYAENSFVTGSFTFVISNVTASSAQLTVMDGVGFSSGHWQSVFGLFPSRTVTRATWTITVGVAVSGPGG